MGELYPVFPVCRIIFPRRFPDSLPVSCPSSDALPARDPPRHGLTIRLISGAEGLAQIRLLVGPDEQVEADQQEDPVDCLRQCSKPGDVPGLDQQRADVHRVADEVVQPADDQFLGWVERDRGAASLADEVRRAPDDDCNSNDPKRDGGPVPGSRREGETGDVGDVEDGDDAQQEAGDEDNKKKLS